MVPSFQPGPLFGTLPKWQSQKLLSNHTFFEREIGENQILWFINRELFFFKEALLKTQNQPGYKDNYIMMVTKQQN